MIKKLKNWAFPDAMKAGTEFAASLTKQEIDKYIEYARHFNEYGDFERGMEMCLQHRAND